MKHRICASTPEQAGHLYDAVVEALNNLGISVVKIKFNTLYSGTTWLTIWDDAPWWRTRHPAVKGVPQ